MDDKKQEAYTEVRNLIVDLLYATEKVDGNSDYKRGALMSLGIVLNDVMLLSIKDVLEN